MSDLHVRNKGETIGHEHVTPALEEHHGYGTARKHVTDDELSDDVEASLLTSECLDDS